MLGSAEDHCSSIRRSEFCQERQDIQIVTGRGTLLEYMEEGKINPAQVGPEGGACRTGNWLKGLERKGGKAEKDPDEQHEEMEV